MSELKEKLEKFKGLLIDRPIIIDPSLILLFRDLGERSDRAITLSMVIQRIARMAARTKSLDLSMQEYFDLFPFTEPRHLRKCLYLLREYGIWKNKKYRPHTNMAAYTNIRINWKSVARLAKKVKKEQEQKNRVKMMCQRLNGE
jgi:hypothetical protein